jgi:two-component system response regulator MprA
MTVSVLLVDDDPGIRGALGALLEDEGYRVVEACDGLEALDRVEADRPSLILLDLMMPRLDGYGFTRELRRRGLSPAIPIVVITADGLGCQKVAPLEVEACMSKPFEIDDLLDTVSRLLQVS